LGYSTVRQGFVSGGEMNLKTKNALTALILFVIVICIYVFTVLKATSQ
jgi:preprotein translocase subunit SecF